MADVDNQAGTANEVQVRRNSSVPEQERQAQQQESRQEQEQEQEQEQGQEPPRKRARLSCNTCKARKTKCIGIETGSCHYCRSVNLTCEASVKSRKRPFYRVSGEVYEYSIKLLRRFVPEDELPELTVENIQDLLQKLDDRPPVPVRTPPITSGGGVLSVENGDSLGPAAEADADGTTETMEPEEHTSLQEEFGCMLLDSMGRYRYVGANSSIRWFNAIRTAREPRGVSQRSDPKIITPLNFGPLPPTTPESGNGGRRTAVYLPPRQLCMAYVARFFDQLHCTYWFYPSEQFYPRLDQTLEDRGASASSSWLCALYSILTIGSMAPADNSFKPKGNGPQDTKTSADYLSMAKDEAAAATEEAGLDSVKAFGLMSLATHAMCYSITAYLNIGTAVRIGFSLGLHRDVFLRSKGSLERERSRRLWWTIYILDYEMASRFGYPCSIMDDAVFMSTPPATEHILGPGPNTPLDYQALLVSLTRMSKMISHECFLEPAHVGGRLPISRVTRSLAALRRWYDGIPTHLRWDSSLHPQHRRAVSILHLRFWLANMSLTRPFLLFMVTRSSDTMIPGKRMLYEQMSNTCIEAAEAAVNVIRRMREDQTLSSLLLFDSNTIGEVMDVLIMALQKLGGTVRQAMLQFCIETFRTMEKIGWCERLSAEFETMIPESGVMQPRALPPAQPMQAIGQLNPYTPRATPHIPGENETPAFTDYHDMNFDGAQFDVFETLDLETSSGLLEMFTDASFSGSQFLFDNPDRAYQV
ncbi:uncharacterized protein DNG_10407 [Cephalotrichum gorgonifer]|uniref:Zn(2)-C6 fungal-type domain-containing protein n=1 Tax=Cephalotrichum gorgonifer TaxID=2041049 RepID=A0AAE8T0N1_9PEZI|nr:uncharacterized protein DNG_10407 [Cephalotrichum gorgonifer]